MSKEKVLVSGCLLGINCRYNGVQLDKRQLEIDDSSEIIPICPETLGNLPIPRPPSFFSNHLTGDGVLEGKCKVITENNEDKTENFLAGANEVLQLAKLHNVKKVYLKENSPSCGKNFVYVGEKKVKGKGVTVALLEKHGIEIISVD